MPTSTGNLGERRFELVQLAVFEASNIQRRTNLVNNTRPLQIYFSLVLNVIDTNVYISILGIFIAYY